jgi:hypothetical protein
MNGRGKREGSHFLQSLSNFGNGTLLAGGNQIRTGDQPQDREGTLARIEHAGYQRSAAVNGV